MAAKENTVKETTVDKSVHIEYCNLTGVSVPETPKHVTDAIIALAQASGEHAKALKAMADKLQCNPTVYQSAPLMSIQQAKE